ncbi:Protein kinase-like domain protein [Niveomyces insectorum RCEF 264]|uniref:Protein kinase-like domain protein n=1 Tax=Niveomyces insectorum RCEF 264 TaxID=1081102 RepID=A0A167XRG4_9HYPO|nr:Protein kinase-like domain protein [Niveomyces insectorum RCEF 264]
MDCDVQLEQLAKLKGNQWLDRVVAAWPQIPAWITEHHPKQLPCSVQSRLLHGSYNIGLTAAFAGGETWFVRLPLAGQTSEEHLDLKIANEVAALRLIRAKTDIPVPDVKAWGLAHENRLGLGPFIMEQFIHGERLKPILSGSDDPDAALLSADLDKTRIDVVYRQIARFMLQLFTLDFDHIGNLSDVVPRAQPPLTIAANELARLAKVNAAGRKKKEMATSTEYFDYLAAQHWQQFVTQRNSVYEEKTGRQNYVFRQVLMSLAARHVWPDYDRGPFKLICDDFGPANMLVDNKQDLNIVGVVDLEWSYSGPAQLLATAPWWLLQIRPNALEPTDEMATMFRAYLDRFVHILDAEEARLPPDQRRGLAALVRCSTENGTMWYHMVLRGFFIDATDLPSWQLRISTPDWAALAADVPPDEAVVQQFVAAKLRGLRAYFDGTGKTKAMVEALAAGQVQRQAVIEHIEALYR